jgi:hypothetical protein
MRSLQSHGPRNNIGKHFSDICGHKATICSLFHETLMPGEPGTDGGQGQQPRGMDRDFCTPETMVQLYSLVRAARGAVLVDAVPWFRSIMLQLEEVLAFCMPSSDALVSKQFGRLVHSHCSLRLGIWEHACSLGLINHAFFKYGMIGRNQWKVI